MIVVAHQDVSMNSPTGSGAHLLEGPEKEFAVGVISKDGLAPVSTVEDVVNGSGKLHSHSSGHENSSPESPAVVKKHGLL